MKDNIAIILAAGSSQRMGPEFPDKPLIQVEGQSILSYSLKAFQASSNISKICIVTKDNAQATRIKADLGVSAYPINYCQGGLRRQDSVRNALLSIKAQPSDIVLIHDGARPLIQSHQIDSLIKAAQISGAASLARRATDSIIQVNSEGQKALNRDELWLMETPQAFQFALLQKAHDHAKHLKASLTDDCSAMIGINQTVTLIENTLPNLKVTYPEDLALIADYLKQS